jgi:phosphoadenosine phosphosulfate reductase
MHLTSTPSLNTSVPRLEPPNQSSFDTRLERPGPEFVLRWAAATFGPELVMTTGLGLNGVALIHMLQAMQWDVPLVFVDTGYHFPETLETKARIEAAYGIRILTFSPTCAAAAQGRPADPEVCCQRRKVEPMQQALAELRPAAVLNGRSRFQASTRRGLPVVEWGQSPIRINPLACWSLAQVRSYVATHKVPYNPLHDAGYPSIGCWPCTCPVQPGEDLRAGRWPGTGKVECGLWTRAECGG